MIASFQANKVEPILIGHSVGGVLVQHRMDRGLGVVIDPAPAPGVPLYPHAIISALPIFLDLFSRNKVKHMSHKPRRRSIFPKGAEATSTIHVDRGGIMILRSRQLVLLGWAVKHCGDGRYGGSSRR